MAKNLEKPPSDSVIGLLLIGCSIGSLSNTVIFLFTDDYNFVFSLLLSIPFFLIGMFYLWRFFKKC
jgi:hypothetical protein